MLRDKAVRLGLVVALSLGVPAAFAACDREAMKDVEEGVDEVDKEIDKLDSDGKDD